MNITRRNFLASIPILGALCAAKAKFNSILPKDQTLEYRMVVIEIESPYGSEYNYAIIRSDLIDYDLMRPVEL